MENLLLENGDLLLLENGNGIFLESYVPPEVFIEVDVVVDDAEVDTTLRVNTPKEFTVDVVVGTPVVTIGVEASAPEKFLTVDVEMGPAVVTLAPPNTAVPSYTVPKRDLIWVYNYAGEVTNVIV